METKTTPVWADPQLSQEIISNEDIFNELDNIVYDITKNNIGLTKLAENMAEVLTHPDVENRVKGMTFLTQLLHKIPKDYLSEMELKYMSKFYTDRLQDNHRVVPSVLEGYLHIVNMHKYEVVNCNQFLTVLFRDIPCQSQGTQDRYHIYKIIQTLYEKDFLYLKTLAPDLVYNIVSAIDGERDPTNLYFLFNFLKLFLARYPLGHLTDNIFEVLSCYYPVDFHPSSDEPDAVTRQDLANELAQCLTATPKFAENCLPLLLHKLDSDLRVAKLDSLNLLVVSCKTFESHIYIPFLNTLWSSLYRDILHKTDGELKMAAYQALVALLVKLVGSSEDDKTLENFIKGIIKSVQTTLAEATTVSQVTQSTKILMTVANSCSEACKIVQLIGIPATINYYEFHTSSKIQVAILTFLGDLLDSISYWSSCNQSTGKERLNLIATLCLTAVSESNKELKIEGFKTFAKNLDYLEENTVAPFVEILIFNMDNAEDKNLKMTSIKTIYCVAQKYPEMIWDSVVKGKCDQNNYLMNKHCFMKRINLLCRFLSLKDFVLEIVLLLKKVLNSKDENALSNDEVKEIVKSLSEVISDSSIFSENKLAQLNSEASDLFKEVVFWIDSEITSNSIEDMKHSFNIVSLIAGAISGNVQVEILQNKAEEFINCVEKKTIKYFMSLSAICKCFKPKIFGNNFLIVYDYAIKMAYSCKEVEIKTEACILVSHFINKISDEHLNKFDLMIREREDMPYEVKDTLQLYGYVTRALMNRQTDNQYFVPKLNYILLALTRPEDCIHAAEAIKIMVQDTDEYLSPKQRCLRGILYRQRLFEMFLNITEGLEYKDYAYECYLLSLLYILKVIPRNVLMNSVDKVITSVINSLSYNNKELVVIATDLLAVLVKVNKIANSTLQTILPRLVKLSTYPRSMDVRIKSLECLYEIGNNYPTVLLLPFKPDLVYDLAPCLDDPKRLVRSMAVKARTRWFLIGAPGENN